MNKISDEQAYSFFLFIFSIALTISMLALFCFSGWLQANKGILFWDWYRDIQYHTMATGSPWLVFVFVLGLVYRVRWLLLNMGLLLIFAYVLAAKFGPKNNESEVH